MQLVMEIPDDLIQAIKLPSAEIPNRLKRELAVRLYRKGLLGFGKSRELAGMSYWGFHEALGEEDIPRHYDVEELEEDLKTIKDIL